MFSKPSGRQRLVNPRVSTRLGPTALFGVTLVFSMAGRAYAMRTLPVGTATPFGWESVRSSPSRTVITGDEGVSWAKFLLLAITIGGVIGLKMLH